MLSIAARKVSIKTAYYTLQKLLLKIMNDADVHFLTIWYDQIGGPFFCWVCCYTIITSDDTEKTMQAVATVHVVRLILYY